jgi:transposase InsO family protein
LFVEQEKEHHSVKTMCRLLGVSTSGYYAWRSRKPSKRAQENAELQQRITEIHQQSRGTYGAPRVHAELRKGQGVRCSKKRVARLMRLATLAGICRGRRYGCTRRNPAHLGYPDLVKREFKADAPDQLWVADMTQHQTGEGWLYLAVVVDMFCRKVVGWAMGNRPTAELVSSAVDMAVQNRRPSPGVIHHSDHGAQYTSLAFGKALQEAGIVGSMGSVGDAYDNAAAESFFATLQAELLDRRSWLTRRELRTAIFEYIEAFYNRRRRHSSLDYLSPSEFEEQWTRTTATNVEVACD